MAERRMFAKSIIGSARFLRMPATSRLLYYDLGMDADDDGCVEAFGVMRKTGATEDDLRVLATKGFIRILNSDFVSYIQDWNTNNQIRKDRYHAGIYKALIDCTCNVIIECDNQMTTTCQPDDNQMATEYRLGEDSIGQYSIGKEIKAEFEPPTVDEIRAYISENGFCVNAVSFFDYYASNGWTIKGVKMADWKATVRSWHNRKKESEKPRLDDLDDIM